MDRPNTKNFPFVPNPVDGDVVFHKNVVCQYYASSNTWACQHIIKKNETYEQKEGT